VVARREHVPDGFSLAIGRSIRHARMRRGWTLREVSVVSDGGFKSSATAAYERGERDISLRRFCELSVVLGVPPAALLSDALGQIAPPERDVDIDLAHLSEVRAVGVPGLLELLEEITRIRREPEGDVITLRTGDLQILATASGLAPDDLIDRLGAAVLRR
jgi:transcriptional regulator with XRE-family HTH domain